MRRRKNTNITSIKSLQNHHIDLKTAVVIQGVLVFPLMHHPVLPPAKAQESTARATHISLPENKVVEVGGMILSSIDQEALPDPPQGFLPATHLGTLLRVTALISHTGKTIGIPVITSRFDKAWLNMQN